LRSAKTFINNTVNVQINDVRKIPVIIPKHKELNMFESLFDDAFSARVDSINKKISSDKEKEILSAIQNKLNDLVNKLYGFN